MIDHVVTKKPFRYPGWKRLNIKHLYSMVRFVRICAISSLIFDLWFYTLRHRPIVTNLSFIQKDNSNIKCNSIFGRLLDRLYVQICRSIQRRNQGLGQQISSMVSMLQCQQIDSRPIGLGTQVCAWAMGLYAHCFQSYFWRMLHIPLSIMINAGTSLDWAF